MMENKKKRFPIKGNTFWVLLCFFVSCSNDNSMHNPDNYRLEESKPIDSCTVYQMIFDKGDYLFRFAVAGSCKQLTVKLYINEYHRFINNNKSKFLKRDGLIIFEHNYNDASVESLIERITAITQLEFEANVTLIARTDNNFTIKILKK